MSARWTFPCERVDVETEAVQAAKAQLLCVNWGEHLCVGSWFHAKAALDAIRRVTVEHGWTVTP